MSLFKNIKAKFKDKRDEHRKHNPLQIEKIGRNEPCPCGSGRKYKKCCLGKNEKIENKKFEKEEGLTDSQLATRKVINWASDKHKDVVKSAMAQLIGQCEVEKISEKFGDGDEWLQLVSQVINEYALLDYEYENWDETLLEHYLKEKGDTLSEEEKQLLSIKLNTYKTLYEIQEIKFGKSLLLKDYFSGENFWVKENRGTWNVTKWDIIFARVETYPNGERLLTGSAIEFPRGAEDELHDLKDQYTKDKRIFGNDETKWLFNFRHTLTPMIFQSLVNFYANSKTTLVNKDGDELIFCEKKANVTDHEKVMEYLDNQEVLTLTYNDGKELVYGWLDKDDSFIVSFYLKKKTITAETNSKERMQLIEEKFICDLIPWTKNWKDEFTKPDASMKPSISGGDEKLTIETKFIPESKIKLSKKEEAQLRLKQMRDYYNKWIDMEIPALSGMTPREAGRKPEMKERLVDLLKTMENRDLRSKKSTGVEIDRIKKELNVEF